MMIAAAD